MNSYCFYLYIVFSLLIYLDEFSCSKKSVYDISDSESSENESKVYKSRIEGRSIAKIEDYPYNAFLLNKYIDGSNRATVCSASIIGIKWILTAGHCKNVDSITSKLEVYVGSTNYLQGTKHTVKNAIRHPSYDVHYITGNISSYADYDYMVLELKNELVYGKKIAKILIGINADILHGKEALITGYGTGQQTMKHSKDPLKVLRVAKVDIMARRACAAHYPELSLCDFCAGRKGISMCLGDSGGPIVSDTPLGRRLLGVASSGPEDEPDSDCQEPSVYSSVPFVKEWIFSIIGESENNNNRSKTSAHG